MSEMTSLEMDTDARKRIVSDLERNFFVKAGAGSGKTTMLVNRMVALVENNVPIKEICAITFTNAAAGEFRERFRSLLTDRANPEYNWKNRENDGGLPAPTEETRERCAKALQDIDLCFMGTIDAFCYMVLSEHPSEARIPSGVALVSDWDAEAFYRRQYVKICSGEYGKALKESANVFRPLFWDDDEAFAKSESFLMRNRNVHFNYTQRSAADLDKEFEADKERLVKAVKCLAEHPELKYTSGKDNLIAWDNIENICKILQGQWSKDFPNVVNKTTLGSLKNLRTTPEAVDRYRDELEGIFKAGGAAGKWLECKEYVQEVKDKLESFRYSVVMPFLTACVPQLADAMREKGIMTFFDCLYYLRNMLRDDAGHGGNLIRYINARHRRFLIDEFQDTDPLQAEIFFYLSSDEPDRRWSACEPRAGSLFIVGDPKQSIYRFRGADVASFHKVQKLIEEHGGSTLSLSRNFRSASCLCEYFNRRFKAMELEDFEEIPVPAAKDDEFRGIFTYRAYIRKIAARHPDEADPVQVEKIIKKLVNNDAYRIRTGDDENPRKIQYNDIMVITSGKEKLGPIMERLNEQGIPTRVEGKVLFGKNDALNEIYRIYAAVADGNNSAALYGALTGKLIGLTKEEILAYKTAGGKLSLKSASAPESCGDETVCRVASKIGKLSALYREARRLSPAGLFSKILDGFRIYETVKAEKLEEVCYALELLRNAEKSEAVSSPKDGAAYLDGLLHEEPAVERCLSLKEENEAVHLANLHKVKGLEAPVVILSAAKFSNKPSTKRIVHGDDGAEGYLFAMPDYTYLKTTEFPNETAQEDAERRKEEQRLIYVAATRARNALIICDSITTVQGEHESAWTPIMEDGLKDFFGKNTADAVPDMKGKEGDVEALVLYDEAEKSCALKNRATETATYTVENPSRLHLTSKASREEETDQVTVPAGVTGGDAEKEGDSPRFPALFGTMTHKLMEMLVSSKGKADDAGAVREILGEYLTPETEPYEKELKEKLTAVVKQMRDGGYEQQNGLPQDILGTLLTAEKVYCEVPFCYAEDGQDGRILWNGVADVVYKAQGKWHIVDYKTDADNSDLDKKHRAQLSAYEKAFKEITGEDADARTYRIDI